MTSYTETAGAGRRRSRKRTRGRHDYETCNNNENARCQQEGNNSRTGTIASHSRLALAAATILLLGGQTNNNSYGMGVVVDAAAPIQSEKGIQTDEYDVNNDVHVSPSDTASGTGNRAPTTNAEAEEQPQHQQLHPPHFPHSSFISHGHPSDPHVHNLHAMSYPLIASQYHHPTTATASSIGDIGAHGDWFHARIQDVEPTRLHGGFTYTDAHVPTPLTYRRIHGSIRNTEQQQQNDNEDGIDGTDDQDADNQEDENSDGDNDASDTLAATAALPSSDDEAVHHYLSIPGIVSSNRKEFPDFDHFQHDVEERIQIDQVVERTIEYNINHAGADGRVEDLSEILKSLKDQQKKQAQQRAEEVVNSQQRQSWWEILGIKKLLVDASLAGLSSNMIAMQQSCKDEVAVDSDVGSKVAVDSDLESKEENEKENVSRSRGNSNGRNPAAMMGYLVGEAEFRRKGKENGREDHQVDTAAQEAQRRSADGPSKLFWRELIRAAQTSTGIAAITTDASVAAAVMAAAAVELEKDVQSIEGEKSSLLALPSSQRSNNGGNSGGDKRTNQFIVRQEESSRQSSSYAQDYPGLDDFDIESSRLLSASFALVSNSLGLFADTVRILGDTAAAVSGASVKIVGTTVKSVSNGLEGAGKRIELGRDRAREESLIDSNGKALPKKRKPLTSEKLLAGQKTGVHGLLHRDTTEEGRSVRRSTRRVLGKSVRLLASVGRGVGDSLVFAGSATETLASSTAGVAEEAVRLFEDFAGSLSNAFQVKGSWPGEEAPQVAPSEPPGDYSPWYSHDPSHRPSIVSFGRYDSDDAGDRPSQNATTSDDSSAAEESIMESAQRLLKFVVSESIAFIDFALADTEHVESLSPDLFGVLLLCYVSSIVLLSIGTRRSFKELSSQTQCKEKTAEPLIVATTEKGSESRINTEIIVPPIPTIPTHIIRRHRHHRASYCVGAGILMAADSGEQEGTLDSDSLTAEGVDPVHIRKQEGEAAPSAQPSEFKGDSSPSSLQAETRRVVKLWHILCAIVMEPFRVTLILMSFWFRFFFDRRVILLCIYGVAGLYLCRASQLRSRAIGRNAEAAGFRAAVSSVGSTSPSMRESAVWLNALLDEMWRVPLEENTTPLHVAEYPDFITKAMKYARRKKSCREATGRGKNKSTLCTDMKPYGGLEPYISSILGEAVIGVLTSTSASRPSDLTYVSLHSFTLGSVPPIVRGMRLKGINDKDNTVKLDVDLDVLLGDSSIVLEMKLSTLDYALLPSTQVAIHSFDMRLPLEVTVEMMQEFPFLKGIKVSLSEVPPCRMRVTPLSQNSGLRGVDLGSLPVLNDWIQEALHDALEEYLVPSYVAFDLYSLWYPDTNYADDIENSNHHGEAINDAAELENAIGMTLPTLTSIASEKATAAIRHEPIKMSTTRTAMEKTFEKRKVKHDDGGSAKKTTPDISDRPIKKNRYASSFNAIASQIAETESEKPNPFDGKGQCTVQ